MVTPSSSAFALVSPTAFALRTEPERTTRPSFSNSAAAWSAASWGSAGTSSGAAPKNDVSAVPVYSGYPLISPAFRASIATCSEPRFRSVSTL